MIKHSWGHSSLSIIGIHIEEEAEEEEVDTSLRGRLFSLVDKVKSLRKKNEEEKPEVEEEVKPSKINNLRNNVFQSETSARPQQSDLLCVPLMKAPCRS